MSRFDDFCNELNPLLDEMLTNKEKPFEPGEVIQYAGESYRVRVNYGDHGEVEYLDGISASNKFYWNIYGEECKRVDLEEAECAELYDEYLNYDVGRL